MRISRWIGLAAMLALATTARAQSLQSAQGFVAGLYHAYQRSQPDYLGHQGASVFSPRLLALIRRDERNAHGEVGALDGDPICDCQDPGGVRLTTLSVARSGAGRATARVRLHFPDGPRALVLDLASVAGQWRVDDVHTRGTPSLARLLGGGQVQPRRPRSAP